jgi:hypothetical protein
MPNDAWYWRESTMRLQLVSAERSFGQEVKRLAAQSRREDMAVEERETGTLIGSDKVEGTGLWSR